MGALDKILGILIPIAVVGAMGYVGIALVAEIGPVSGKLGPTGNRFINDYLDAIVALPILLGFGGVIVWMLRGWE